MTDQTAHQPLTDQQLDEIEARANGYAEDHHHLAVLCGPACTTAAEVSALVAEVYRLRALLAQCDHRACAGFPDDCPNPVLVNPDPPVHDGGVRCGCRPAPAAVVSSAAETPGSAR